MSRLWPTALLASSLLCAGAAAQQAFVDDARRRDSLPANVERVFAAGAPAEVLLYTLVPDKLAGRNQIPPAAALKLIPPQYRNPTAIVNLPDRDDPRYDAELLALDVDVYVDYGTVDADYVAALEAISERTRIPGIILDGSVDRAFPMSTDDSAPPSASQSAARVSPTRRERLIDKYRGALGDNAAARLLGVLTERPDAVLRGPQRRRSRRAAGRDQRGGKNRYGGATAPTVAEIRDLAPDVVDRGESGGGGRDPQRPRVAGRSLRSLRGECMRRTDVAVQLGTAAAVRQSLGGLDLDGVRATGAGVRPRLYSTMSARCSRRSTTSRRARSNCVR